MKLDNRIKKEFEYKMKEFFDLAQRDGVTIIGLRVKGKELETPKEVISRLEISYKNLYFFFYYNDNFNWQFLIGIKSVLGYNELLVSILTKMLRESLWLEVKSSSKIDNKKYLKYWIRGFSNGGLVGLGLPDIENYIINVLLDLITSSFFGKNFKFKLIVLAEEFLKFKPVLLDDRNYYLLNLLRFDFVKRKLVLCDNVIKKFSQENSCYEDYISIDDFLISLSDILVYWRKEYEQELENLDLEFLLLGKDAVVKAYFTDLYYLPRISR